MTEELIEEMDLPDRIKSKLSELVRPVEKDEVPYFIAEIQSFEEQLKARSDFHQVADLGLLENIISTASTLLSQLSNYPIEEQMLIFAALRHFILDEEGEADPQHPFGFENDAKVFNEVLYILNKSELVIPI